MELEDWARVVTIVFQSFSTIAIVGAAVKYLWGRDERSGETLLHLETRFKELQIPWQAERSGSFLSSITRAVDLEAHEFEKSGLQLAIDKGLEGRWNDRTDLERAWMSRLDEFIRFLLLVAGMEKNRLLKKRALWDAYHYWFRMVARNPKLQEYVGLYFPVLYRFLRDNEKEIVAYERLHSATAQEAEPGIQAAYSQLQTLVAAHPRTPPPAGHARAQVLSLILFGAFVLAPFIVSWRWFTAREHRGDRSAR
ncbi:MAG: hypothetical protein Q8Q85_14695 [Gemmatimonadales bacterium]|nr:hypothetical protein [Gemmatimonadales bacterium]